MAKAKKTTAKKAEEKKARELRVGDTVRFKGAAYHGNSPFDAKGVSATVREIIGDRVYCEPVSGGEVWADKATVEVQA